MCSVQPILLTQHPGTPSHTLPPALTPCTPTCPHTPRTHLASPTLTLSHLHSHPCHHLRCTHIPPRHTLSCPPPSPPSSPPLHRPSHTCHPPFPPPLPPPLPRPHNHLDHQIQVPPVGGSGGGGIGADDGLGLVIRRLLFQHGPAGHMEVRGVVSGGTDWGHTVGWVDRSYFVTRQLATLKPAVWLPGSSNLCGGRHRSGDKEGMCVWMY